jgi:hypothetical protein
LLRRGVPILSGRGGLLLEDITNSQQYNKCNPALSSKDFDDFTKINSNLYRSHNFDSAKKKVYLDIETGISSIHVSRYNLD